MKDFPLPGDRYPQPFSSRDGKQMTRRSFFERVVDGMGGAALTTLLGQDLYGGLKVLASARSKVSGEVRSRPFKVSRYFLWGSAK